MKYSILLSVAIFGWIAFIYSHKDFFSKQFPFFSANSISSLSIQNVSQHLSQRFPNPKIEIRNRDFIDSKPQIRQNLYNSISEGMSYDEVRSIIGWDGVLIYTNEIDYGGRKIKEKIYQWNNQDIYSTNYDPQRAGDLNPYWSVTLQFQDGALVGKTFYNLQQTK